MREGTASGEIQGQKWQATLTAGRDTDHTGLTQAVAAARQAYDQVPANTPPRASRTWPTR